MTRLRLSLFACLAAGLLPACLLAQSAKPRLAIMDFSTPSRASDRGYDDGSRRAWADPGRMMAELLTTHFTKSGRFDVIERARLYQLLNEKQINVGAGVLGDQARAIGRELGVAAIVVGGYQTGSYGYELAARIISTNDGSTLAAENVIIPVDPNWMDHALAVLAGKLMAPWSKERGYVLDVFLEPDRLPLLLLDLGSAQGAREGRILEVSTAGDQIIHPVTKEVLGTRDVPLATAMIIKAEQEYCYARVSNRAGVLTGPVKMNDVGIDLGIERMQRARLLEEQADVAVDADMSVLTAWQMVPISCDLSEGRLKVDGKEITPNGGSASVRLMAGTHLVELQVGNAALSREVTVTKTGARPKEVAFRRSDLSSSVATRPTSGATTTSTTPATGSITGLKLSPQDRTLAGVLASREQQFQQLKARDEKLGTACLMGLDLLKSGCAKNSRSDLTAAAERFTTIVKDSPDCAAAHFCLGLAKLQLEAYPEAIACFNRAVTLDGTLKGDNPILWWEDFRGGFPAERVTGISRNEPTAWQLQGTPEGLRLTMKKQVSLLLLGPMREASQYVTDSRTRLRFRGKDYFASILSRTPSGGAVMFQCASLLTSLYWYPRSTQFESIAKAAGTPPNAWHVADLTLTGQRVICTVDGKTLWDQDVPGAGPGGTNLCIGGRDELLIDYVLVTKY